MVVAIMASFVYGIYGFQGTLGRDEGIYVYSGQQMADGVPPYVSVFDHKGPLSPMLCGFAVAFGRSIGMDDILACRAIFFGISVLSVVSVFVLSEKVFGSLRGAFFSALTFVAFWGFGIHAASGPRAKTPMVLFQVLALYLTISRRWFWGSLSGSLATLVWQPAIVYPLITLGLAALQASSKRQRLRNVGLALCGIALPVILTTFWFASKGALGEFIDGWITFNFVHLDRHGATIPENLSKMLGALHFGYTHAVVPICLGFLAILLFSITTFSAYRGNYRLWIQEERSVALVVSFPLPFLWSALDYQSYPDFFPFLPYAALGFGWLLSAAISGVEERYAITGLPVVAFCVLVALTMVSVASVAYYRSRNTDLIRQRHWAAELNSEMREDDTVVSVGLPQAMVLTGRRNPTAYGFIIMGIDNYIDAKTEGGFEGWLSNLGRISPSVVLLGITRGRHAPKLISWVEKNYRMSKIGEWAVYRRQVGVEIPNGVQNISVGADKPHR